MFVIMWSETCCVHSRDHVVDVPVLVVVVLLDIDSFFAFVPSGFADFLSLFDGW